MRKALVTGGSGFFGSLLKHRLLDDGVECVSIDLQPDEGQRSGLRNVRGDIRDEQLMNSLLAQHRVDAVFHCAAILAHGSVNRRFLWSCNVQGTRIVAEAAVRHGVGKLVFISSNCLWGESLHRPVTEEDPPRPVEIYGHSKWQAEKVLRRFSEDLAVVVLRCPTIVDAGRLGLLAILFDFIREGRRVWVVGSGDNRYQFVDAGDLVQACMLGLQSNGSVTYNVGSDDVKSLRAVYEHVIAVAGTGARVARLPKRPTVLAMRAAWALRLSPLGRYHWRMISEDFVFDTSKIKSELGWKPTLSNEQMLTKAYQNYESEYQQIHARTDVSAHRQPAKMGAIKLLKWLS